ncbi:hypothetical protein ASE63_00090 [Bosea sp. Root381]|uniref:capsular polysaccharide synthesis protein n=1 Tax=Bosea sp. Root381 TaxID=1736524 RepID=UPI0006F332F0|nr:capsular polysaccharide synthesis protein [Bosea sp. Root381]KRE17650.1 hypothetical protein ASE63_00090 [Bosea sp. Root381]
MKIWTYWENKYSDRMPAYLEMCLESIDRNKGAAEFIIVSPDNLLSYVPENDIPENFHRLVPAHKADYLRSTLLRIHGGMWIDVDTIVFGDLTESVLRHLDDHELVSVGSLSMAFFASRPNGEFVTRWSEAARAQIEQRHDFYWTAIGKAIFSNLKPEPFDIGMTIFGYRWANWKRYLEPAEMDMRNRLACILYNKSMFPLLKDLSREEVLGRDWLVSDLLRRALAEAG